MAFINGLIIEILVKEIENDVATIHCVSMTKRYSLFIDPQNSVFFNPSFAEPRDTTNLFTDSLKMLLIAPLLSTFRFRQMIFNVS